jgi:dCTP deaminase
MILSNVSIQKALDQHWLVIDPPPEPRELSGATDCPYNTSSVDLRLGREIVRLDANLPIVIDLRRNGFAALAEASSTPFLLSDEQPFRLAPATFVLARTLETVSLPIPRDGAPCFAARIEGRSSFARCGLLVHFTAPTVHAGFEGPLVLEMCNLGPYPILLYEKMRICQLIIEQVEGIPFRNESQFHQQHGPRG